MTRFRPCIDLHNGRVKQIVGGTLRNEDEPRTNFVSPNGADWFANRYREDNLTGGHVIQLGPGNQEAAEQALAAWPKGLQLGGGIREDNALAWLENGADKIIVTSWLFDEHARFQPKRMEQLARLVGPEHLVIDLSCRGRFPDWRVAMNRWQTPTDLAVNAETLAFMADFCSEFLIHAADVEGLKAGMDEDLIRMLGAESPLPVTYAGGASRFEDLARTESLSQGRVDLTIGSALDLFGGTIPYADCVAWNRREHSK
ncbi:MAG: phosphoribosylformimino-5-aminoimidazole carboxamide ribotide isomerase [Verrucomicrobia bacterium]|nr:phosphoribosylformimino-5-aminoimidazole carboxamide ribotide isomerase [Verrucomicrobiota bacterium]